MRIQEAIKACQKTPDVFGRPISWKGTGAAVDLAKRMQKDRIMKVTAVHHKAAWGSEWAITPEDLLDIWEIVSVNTLANELEND